MLTAYIIPPSITPTQTKTEQSKGAQGDGGPRESAPRRGDAKESRRAGNRPRRPGGAVQVENPVDP